MSKAWNEEISAIEGATFLFEWGEEGFQEARERLWSLPHEVRVLPAAKVLEGYFLFMDDQNEEARQVLEGAYESAMERGDWRSAAMAAARLLLWHHYHGDDYEEATGWSRKGRDCLVHLEDRVPAAHLFFGEGRFLGGYSEEWQAAVDAYGLAIEEFRLLGDKNREIWATWLRFDVLPEKETLGARGQLGSYDFLEYWREFYIPGELSKRAREQWAEILAVTGALEEAVEFVESSWAQGLEVSSSVQEAKVDLLFQAIHFDSVSSGELLSFLESLVDEIEDREEAGHLQLMISFHLGQHGRIDEAIEVCKGILEVQMPEDLHLLAALNIAMFLLRRGQVEEALEMIPTLEDCEKEGGEILWMYHQVWMLIWLRRGDLDRALFHSHSSLKGEEDLLWFQVLTTLLSEVDILMMLGEFEKAIAILEPLESRIEELPAINRNILLVSLGYCLLGLNRPQDALEYIEEGLKVVTQFPLFRLILLINRLVAAIRLENDELFFESLEELEPYRESYSTHYVKALINKAHYFERKGELEAAVGAYQEALEIYLNSDQLADGADTYDSLCLLYLELGDWEAALENSRKALETLLGLVSLVVGESGRLSILSRLGYCGARYAHLQIEMGQVEDALETIYEVKSGEFLRLLERIRNKEKGDEEVPLPVMMKREPIGLLAISEVEHLQGYEDREESRSSELGQQARERYEELTHLHEEFRDAFVKSEEVRAGLKPGDVAVEYFLPNSSGELLFIFLITAEGVQAQEVFWSEEATALVERTSFLVGASEEQQAASDWEHHHLVEGLRRLYDLLILPIEAVLEEREQLYLSPGARLGTTPFQALLSKEGRFLADMIQVSFLVSTAQLAMSGEVDRTTSTALLLRGKDGEDEAELSGADREIRAVGALLREAGVEFLEEKSFWEAELIHYSGHAYFDCDEPMAGYLVLESGSLEALDFLEHSFKRSPLVVLAGCDTGRFTSLGDEFVGFIRSIFAARASGVITSSWKVNDESAAWFFGRFYEHLMKGLMAREALREAAREMRQSPPDPQWAHPFYWANFRVWGFR